MRVLLCVTCSLLVVPHGLIVVSFHSVRPPRRLPCRVCRSNVARVQTLPRVLIILGREVVLPFCPDVYVVECVVFQSLEG